MKNEIEYKIIKNLDFKVSTAETTLRSTPFGYTEIISMVVPADFPKLILSTRDVIPSELPTPGAIFRKAKELAGNLNSEYEKQIRILRESDSPPRR